MEIRYKTIRSYEDMIEYMDTLVRYVFHKLKKDLPQGHDTTYYPAYYLYRSNMSDTEDMKHLDDGYTAVSIILRKVTKEATTIIVKLDGIDETDWRYDMLSSVYKRAVAAIDNSLDKYFEGN